MADIKQISIGNDVYDIKDSTARSGLANKQNKLTAVSPVTITQETVSPTHNYTISGTTASPTYTSYTVNDNYSQLTFGENSMGSVPTDFSDWCNSGNVSWIDIPVDFSSESLTATVDGGTDHSCFVYGAKSGSTFTPYFSAYCWGSSLAGYCLTSLASTTTNEIKYNTTRVTPSVTSTSTSDSNRFKVTLTNNSSSVSFDMEEVGNGTKYTGTGSVSVSGSQVAYFEAVNCIRVFVFSSVSTTGTTYGSSWTLADGTTTNNNISVSYDGSTITKNSSNQLQASSLVGLTSTVSELNILDGVTATASEINVLDGITASTTELNYTDGVTSAIQTQLNGKASTDASNVTSTGKETIVGWVMPDYSAGVTVSSLPYTADMDYLCTISNTTTSGWLEAKVDGETVFSKYIGTAYVEPMSTGFILPRDGVLSVSGSYGSITTYPLKGAN